MVEHGASRAEGGSIMRIAADCTIVQHPRERDDAVADAEWASVGIHSVVNGSAQTR